MSDHATATSTEPTNQDIAQGLRGLADFLDEHEALPAIGEKDIAIYVWALDDASVCDEMFRIARMLGEARRAAIVGKPARLELTRAFGPVRLRFYTDADCCEKRTVVQHIDEYEIPAGLHGAGPAEVAS